MARVRDARTTKGGHTLFHCAGAAPVRGSPSCRAREGRGRGGAPRARCRTGCACAHPRPGWRARGGRARRGGARRQPPWPARLRCAGGGSGG
eukprot:4169149-Prymnesium_polylepis.1